MSGCQGVRVRRCQGARVQRGAQCKFARTTGRGCQVTNFARENFSFSRSFLTITHREAREHCRDDPDSDTRNVKHMCRTCTFSTFRWHFPSSFVSLSLCRMSSPAGPQAGLRVSSSSIYGVPPSVSTFSRRAARDGRRRRADASHVRVKGEGVARVSVVARVVRVAGCSGRVGEVTG